MLQQFYPQPPAHRFRYELNKDMNFATAHLIPHDDAGDCANIHGHTYFVNITVAGNKLDHTGFLINFKAIKQLVHGRYDHRFLNNLTEFGNRFDPQSYPTTENVAREIWETIQSELNATDNQPVCIQVVVRETPTSYIIYRPTEEDFYNVR